MLWILAGLSVLLFLHNTVRKVQIIQLSDWNAFSEGLSTSPKVIQSGDCLFPLKKAYMFAAPYSKYAESVDCTLTAGAEYPPKSPGLTTAPTHWGPVSQTVDIGWDAYSVWYSRAAHLFFESQTSEWPGLARALTDVNFLEASPSIEHRKYPWLVSVIYFAVLKVAGTASPVLLQVLQCLIFACVGWLFWANRGRLPVPWVILFAFAPIGGVFLFALYADIWLVLFLLLSLHFYRRQQLLALTTIAILAVWIKAEGWVQIAALLVAFFIFSDQSLRRKLCLPLLAAGLSAFAYFAWAGQISTGSYYTSLFERLTELSTYTQRLPKIIGYFLDVLFRPSLWGVLWPLCVFQIARTNGRPKSSLTIVASLMTLIVLAFLRFPDGAFKEVVLTGSNRALWQCLPLLYFLVSQGQPQTRMTR
jgi:hypothetical protein